MQSTTTFSDRRFVPAVDHPAFALAAIALISFNLRPTLTGVGPLIGEIQHQYGLSGQSVSLLSMMPVICLGVFAPTAPILARRFGTEAVLFGALILLAFGTVLRSLGHWQLVAGTIVLSSALSVLGVLCPVFIKKVFPHRVGMLMGMLSMTMGFGAAFSAGTAVPFKSLLGDSWQMALMVWAIPAILASLAFLPQLTRNNPTARSAQAVSGDASGTMRHALTWQVTGLLALISSISYAVFSWAPSIVQSHGLSASEAGYIVSLSYFAQMITGFSAPTLAGRLKDQRALIVVLMSAVAVGLYGLVFSPPRFLALFAIILGLGQGGAFGVALSLILLRTRSTAAAVKLSSLSQTFGYITAGVIGPYAVGVLFSRTQSWEIVIHFLGLLCLAALACGYGAGRNKHIP